MVESFWTRLTSPITGLAGGTWEGMKESPSLNPFSETFETIDTIKLSLGAIVVILVIVAGVYVLSNVLIMAASSKAAYKSMRGK